MTLLFGGTEGPERDPATRKRDAWMTLGRVGLERQRDDGQKNLLSRIEIMIHGIEGTSRDAEVSEFTVAWM